MNRHIAVFLGLLGIGVLLLAVKLSGHAISTPRITTSDRCTKLQLNKTSARITYPEDFVSESDGGSIDGGSIRLYSRSGPDKHSPTYSISVSVSPFESLAAITENSMSDDGIQFATTTFRNFDAAYGQEKTSRDPFWLKDYYIIPLNQANVTVVIDHTELTGPRRDAMQKMIGSIELASEAEHITPSTVSDCTR